MDPVLSVKAERLVNSDKESPIHLGPDFDSYSSSEEELECQRECDYACNERWGSRLQPTAGNSESLLDQLAVDSKLILFAFIPMIGRQLGSYFIRKGTINTG